MRKLIKLKYILPLAVFLIIGGYWYFRGAKEPEIEYVEARRADVIQEVSVTGKVKADATLNLAFEKSGIVRAINIKIGDRVLSGSVLVLLDNASLWADLREAEAALEIAEIKLKEARRGARPEEIRIYEAKVASAEFAEEDARKNLLSKLSDSLTKADDAVRVKADQLRVPAAPIRN